jgi:cytochrome c oxidase assembly protein subunit 15
MISNKNHIVALWLLTIAIMLICMISIGGYTRLTNSGLSIVEWKPVTGIFYPMSENSWIEEFNKYKNSPEYKIINFDMTREQFKQIYFVEYFHRLFGRLIGFVFFMPLIFFAIKKYFHKNDIYKFLGIFLIGGIQAIIGWYMVKSGLYNMPYVSHFRLSFHLLMAILIFSIIFWQFLNYFNNQFGRPITFNNQAIFLLAILILQIFYGGLVAGLDAGKIYNEFPKMGNGLIPFELANLKLIDLLFFDHASVQFIHRWIGIIFLSLIVIFLYKNRNSKAQKLYISLTILVSIQVSLGIMTLITNVELLLALLHQLVAIFLISNLLLLIHSLTYRQ